MALNITFLTKGGGGSGTWLQQFLLFDYRAYFFMVFISPPLRAKNCRNRKSLEEFKQFRKIFKFVFKIFLPKKSR